MKFPQPFLIGVLILALAPGLAAEKPDSLRQEPILGRISFSVPPGRMAEFEKAYEEKVVPVMKRFGLLPVAERGRATPDSIFARLWEVASLEEASKIPLTMSQDSTILAVLMELGKTFGQGPGRVLRPSLSLYSRPALGQVVPVSERVVPAGPGIPVTVQRRSVSLRTFDSGDGVFGLRTRAILQDRQGNLWVGTERALNRFDGEKWTTFSSADGLGADGIGSLLEDRQGRLWVGTFGGLSRFTGRGFVTIPFPTSLFNNMVMALYQDRDGRIWMGTHMGAVLYDGKGFTFFSIKDGLAGRSVWSILQDRSGNIWFGGSGGAARYDGKTFTRYAEKEGLRTPFVWKILEDREGNLWFGTNSSSAIGPRGPDSSPGVFRYDGRRFTQFTRKDGLAGNVISSILQGRDGRLWFGGTGEFGQSAGVTCYDGRGFTPFTHRDGLPDETVYPVIR